MSHRAELSADDNDYLLSLYRDYYLEWHVALWPCLRASRFSLPPLSLSPRYRDAFSVFTSLGPVCPRFACVFKDPRLRQKRNQSSMPACLLIAADPRGSARIWIAVILDRSRYTGHSSRLG